MMKDPPHGIVKTSPRLNERPNTNPTGAGKKTTETLRTGTAGGPNGDEKTKKNKKKEKRNPRDQYPSQRETLLMEL